VKVQFLAVTTSGGRASGQIELGPTTLNLIRRLHLVGADGDGPVIAAGYGECLDPIDQPLLCWPYSMRPRFSPDSRWIVYNVGRMGYQAPPDHGLCVVSVASALRGRPNPTKLPLTGYWPQWRP
jgi:hypothetical protein